jgi:hypothetical protein
MSRYTDQPTHVNFSAPFFRCQDEEKDSKYRVDANERKWNGHRQRKNRSPTKSITRSANKEGRRASNVESKQSI